jgi:hypothetical protein
MNKRELGPQRPGGLGPRARLHGRMSCEVMSARGSDINAQLASDQARRHRRRRCRRPSLQRRLRQCPPPARPGVPAHGLAPGRDLHVVLEVDHARVPEANIRKFVA